MRRLFTLLALKASKIAMAFIQSVACRLESFLIEQREKKSAQVLQNSTAVFVFKPEPKRLRLTTLQDLLAKSAAYNSTSRSHLDTTLIAFLFSVYSFGQQIVITEIQYNDPGNTEVVEFVELHNASTTPFDLTGCTFVQGFFYNLSPDTIPAGGYFVVARDSAAFRNAFGFDADQVWTNGGSGGLSNSGEDITLEDINGITLDSVDYDDGAPWPIEADGQGYALQLCDITLDNNDPSNWGIVPNSVQGVVNVTGDSIFATPGVANICSSSQSSSPCSMTASISSQTNVSCNGFSDGAATAIANGGTMPYTYFWSNSSTTASITSVVAGTYSVTITDANGCTDSSSVVVLEPVALSLTLDSVANVMSGGDGAAQFEVNGGTSPYLFTWSNSFTQVAPAPLRFQSFEASSEDTWNFTVSPATYNTEGDSIIDGSDDVWAVLEEFTNDIDTASNGLYFWGGQDLNNPNGGGFYYHYVTFDAIALDPSVSHTFSFDYFTDGYDSSDSLQYQVKFDNSTNWDTTGVDLQKNTQSWTTETITVPTGTNFIRFRLQSRQDGSSDFVGLDNVILMPNTPGATISTLQTGLSAGSYTVTVTDANGCTDTSSATITASVPPVQGEIVITEISYNPPESGSDSTEYIELHNTGSSPINLLGYQFTSGVVYTFPNVSISAGGYVVVAVDSVAMNNRFGVNTYQWFSGGLSNGGEPIALKDASGNLIDSLRYDDISPWPTDPDGGGHSLVLCDPNSDNTNGANWSASNSLVAGQIINAKQVYGSPGSDDDACIPAGFIASVAVDSNVSCNGFIDGGATALGIGGTMPYSYLWSNNATTASITGVSAGTYSLTVTDSTGLTDTASIVITEPTALVSTSAVDSNVSCNGLLDAGATASATGGTAPYAFAWSNTASTASITGVAAGTYSVTITDANGCADSSSITLTEPDSLAVSVVLDSLIRGTLPGGFTANVTGAQFESYLWSNGATTSSITVLSAGTYTVTVSDACTSKVATSSITAGPSISLNLDSSVSCNGFTDGGASALGAGGTMPYSYLWSNNATTANITGVSAGTYSVTVTDANGLTDSSSVVITEPAALVSTSAVDSNVSCNALLDAGATASATGGTAPYAFTWSNTASTASITGVGAGSYSVTITDANNCSSVSSVSLTEPLPLLAIATVHANPLCFGDTTGEANVQAVGGTAPYSYTWVTGELTDSISGLDAGSYSVVVTDQNGCFDIALANVVEPQQITSAFANVNDPSCNAATDGAASVIATGGTAPYTYAWNNSTSIAMNTGLSAGTHTVSITDNNGCTHIDSIILVEPMLLDVTISSVTNALCNGSASGTASAQATGGTAPYAFTWSSGTSGSSAFSLLAGTYSVLLSDASGCTDTANVTITEPTALVVAPTVNSDVSCNGLSDGDVSVAVTGGTSGYTYNWSNGVTTASNQGIMAGTYTVSVTDGNGCIQTISTTITEPAMLTIALDQTNAICEGDATGTAFVSNATGGVAPFTYGWSTGATGNSLSNVAAGFYTVTLTDANGCTLSDSIEVLDGIPVVPTIGNINESCETGSPINLLALPSGGTFSGPGVSGGLFDPTAASIGTNVITYTFVTTDGCTYSSTAEALVRANPIVTLGDFSDSICLEANEVACPVGTPAGGIYSGVGVQGLSFVTDNAGLGMHTVVYTYTDVHGCFASDSTVANVVSCFDAVGDEELGESSFDFTLYPNPNNGSFRLTHNSIEPLQGAIYSLDGRLIQQLTLNGTAEQEVILTSKSKGIYLLKLTADGINENVPFIVQ